MRKHIVRAHLGTIQRHALTLVDCDSPGEAQRHLPSVCSHMVRAILFGKGPRESRIRNQMLRAVLEAHDRQLDIGLDKEILLGKIFFDIHVLERANARFQLVQNLKLGIGIGTRVLAKACNDATGSIVETAGNIDILTEHDLSADFESERLVNVGVANRLLELLGPLRI